MRAETTRHGLHRASLALPARGRSTATLIRSARPASSARCFSALSSSDAGFFTREFVGSAFLVRGTSALRRDRTLRLRIHRRKSPRCFSGGPGIARRSVAVCPAVAYSFVYSVHSASLVQPVVCVISLVCHYSVSCRNIRVEGPACAVTARAVHWTKRGGHFPGILMRKRQAANPLEVLSPHYLPGCGFLPFSHVCERLCY